MYDMKILLIAHYDVIYLKMGYVIFQYGTNKTDASIML